MNSRKFRKSEKDMVNIPLDETDGLAKQDKDNINLEELTAATPEVISRQVCRLVILWIWPLYRLWPIIYGPENKKFPSFSDSKLFFSQILKSRALKQL